MNPYIELSDIGFAYKNAGFCIKGLSLGFFRGEAVALTGHNGSGKTTLSKLMLGILKPQAGDVRIDGESIRKKTLAQTACKVGYLFQNPERQLFCPSVLEEVMFSMKQTGLPEEEARDKAMALLDGFLLGGKRDAYPLKLSGGEKQRLALLTVFAMEPKYYILDEPSTGIDSENRQILFEMLKRIKNAGNGICIVSHDRHLVENIADRVIVMERGRVIRDEKA